MTVAVTPLVSQALSSSRRDDQNFRVVLAACLFAALLPMLWIPYIQLPEPDRKTQEALPPQLAKLIPEKAPVPIPEPVKPEEPKKDEKPEPEKKPEPPKPESKKPQTVEKAREVASKSGLLAMQDDLAELRDSLSMDDLVAPAEVMGDVVVETMAPSTNYAQEAMVRSGGVSARTASSATVAAAGLEKRRKLDAPKDTQGAALAAAEASERAGTGKGQRSGAAIRRVFDQNKASIFTLYNRALRNSPGLQGKLVLELVIEPDGSVSSCRVVSSELGDDELAKKIVSRVQLFNFGKQKVSQQTIRYPIDFLPP